MTWEEEALRYANNAEYWKERSVAAEAQLDALRDTVSRVAAVVGVDLREDIPMAIASMLKDSHANAEAFANAAAERDTARAEVERLAAFEECYHLAAAECVGLTVTTEDITGQPVVDCIRSLKARCATLEKLLGEALPFLHDYYYGDAKQATALIKHIDTALSPSAEPAEAVGVGAPHYEVLAKVHECVSRDYLPGSKLRAEIRAALNRCPRCAFGLSIDGRGSWLCQRCGAAHLRDDEDDSPSPRVAAPVVDGPPDAATRIADWLNSPEGKAKLDAEIERRTEPYRQSNWPSAEEMLRPIGAAPVVDGGADTRAVEAETVEAIAAWLRVVIPEHRHPTALAYCYVDTEILAERLRAGDWKPTPASVADKEE